MRLMIFSFSRSSWMLGGFRGGGGRGGGVPGGVQSSLLVLLRLNGLSVAGFVSLEEKVVSICLEISLKSPFFLAMTELKNLDVPSAKLSDSDRRSSRVRCRGCDGGWGWEACREFESIFGEVPNTTGSDPGTETCSLQKHGRVRAHGSQGKNQHLTPKTL